VSGLEFFFSRLIVISPVFKEVKDLIRVLLLLLFLNFIFTHLKVLFLREGFELLLIKLGI